MDRTRSGSASRAAHREHELEIALQAVQHRVAQLQIREQELEIALDSEREAFNSELAMYEHDRGAEHQERAALVVEIERLRSELDRAVHRRIVAEQRCEELERQLVAIQDPDSDGSSSELAVHRLVHEPSRSALLHENERLVSELNTAQQLRRLAELRCLDLERKLEEHSTAGEIRSNEPDACGSDVGIATVAFFST
jgi:hypothetical protein